MQRVSCNDGWEFRPRENAFLELFGGDAPWAPVRLPHDAMIHGRRDPSVGWGTGYFPGGAWEYRKELHVPEEHRGKRLILEFEGVYRSATVYVNGSFAGHRPYGYSNFYAPIDELVEFGAANVIRVEATAHDDARWYSGAGIYRNVKLIVGEAVHLALDGIRVTTPDIDEHRAVVEVATVVENDGRHPTATMVTTEIVDPGGAVVARDVAPVTAWPGRAQTLRQSMVVAQPARWGVDSPSLYTCTTVLAAESDSVGDAELDRETTRFGIRSLQLDAEHGLRINGEVVKLRGACVHHDNGVIGSATIERADERRVELLKAAGFNALRSAHNPMSKAMLDACDRIGMLVMDETFDVWTEPKMNSDYSRAFTEWWEADVAAMVAKDFNHPSVILYSIGNEIPEVGRPDGAARGRALAEAVRRHDPTRFVTNSINPLLALGGELFGSFRESAEEAAAATSGVNTLMTILREYLPKLMRSDVVGERTAESFAAVDVAGYNYLHSRYELDHELFPNRVIVGSETSPPEIAGNWQLVRDHAHVIGDFTWTGWDYLGEAGIGRVDFEAAGEGAALGLMGAYPWLTSRTGDLDITGERRSISYFREIVFGLRTEPYIAVQRPEHHGRTPTYSSNWTLGETVSSWSWPGFEGRSATVEVYADADEVELLVNDVAVGREPAGAGAGYRAWFEVVYEPGTVVAVAYRGGTEIGRTSLRSARSSVRLDVRADRDEIRADDTDLAFVAIALTDDDGIVHTCADRPVTVAVDGPAVLQGLGSGNPCTEQTFGSNTHDTFDGRALAAVRPTGAGNITVTVSTDGCEPTIVEVASLAE